MNFKYVSLRRLERFYADLKTWLASKYTTKAELEAAIANFGGFEVVSLTSGPNPVPDVQDPSTKIIYLTKEAGFTKVDPYTEWIYTSGGVWNVIGETSVDLSGYIEKVTSGTSGNLAKIASGGSLEDSGVAASGVETAVQNAHSHANKAVLDGIPARSGTDSAMLYSADDNSGIAWKNWSYVTVSKKTANSVLIGKTWYPYVQIGNLLWTTENLREPIGTKNTDYWIYDENTVVERGYIYKHQTVIKGESGVESDALQALLHDGWHIPTESDAYNLLGTAGTHWETSGYEFMATDATRITPYTDDKGCTDVYGFHAYPSGCYRSSGGPFTPGYELYNDYATYYTKTPAGTAFAVKEFNIHFFDGSRSASIGNSIGGETYMHCCVRLCKSAT